MIAGIVALLGVVIGSACTHLVMRRNARKRAALIERRLREWDADADRLAAERARRRSRS